MPKPLNVMMSVLNGAPYVAETVQSILDQSYADFDLIVLNNGSTDDTFEILESYNDARLQIVSNAKTVSRTAGLNQLLPYTRAELVAMHDADDISLPTRFEKQVAFMDEHPETSLLGTWGEFISVDGNSLRYFQPPADHTGLVRTSAHYNPFLHTSVVFRREPVVEMGGYPSDYAYAQDFALWLNMMRTLKVAILPETLVQVRIHAGQLGQAPELAVIRAEEIMRLKRYAAAHPDLEQGKVGAGVVNAEFQYAWALYNSGQYARAASWLARSCLRHPVISLTDREVRSAIGYALVGDRGSRAIKRLMRLLRLRK